MKKRERRSILGGSQNIQKGLLASAVETEAHEISSTANVNCASTVERRLTRKDFAVEKSTAKTKLVASDSPPLPDKASLRAVQSASDALVAGGNASLTQPVSPTLSDELPREETHLADETVSSEPVHCVNVPLSSPTAATPGEERNGRDEAGRPTRQTAKGNSSPDSKTDTDKAQIARCESMRDDAPSHEEAPPSADSKTDMDKVEIAKCKSKRDDAPSHEEANLSDEKLSPRNVSSKEKPTSSESAPTAEGDACIEKCPETIPGAKEETQSTKENTKKYQNSQSENCQTVPLPAVSSKEKLTGQNEDQSPLSHPHCEPAKSGDMHAATTTEQILLSDDDVQIDIPLHASPQLLPIPPPKPAPPEALTPVAENPAVPKAKSLPIHKDVVANKDADPSSNQLPVHPSHLSHQSPSNARNEEPDTDADTPAHTDLLKSPVAPAKRMIMSVPASVKQTTIDKSLSPSSSDQTPSLDLKVCKDRKDVALEEQEKPSSPSSKPISVKAHTKDSSQQKGPTASKDEVILPNAESHSSQSSCQSQPKPCLPIPESKVAAPVVAGDDKRKESDAEPVTFSKRVRFSEPQHPFRSGTKSMGYNSIKKMRLRKDRSFGRPSAEISDISIVSASTHGQDKKGRQVLLDELQYLLDGIFKKNADRKSRQVENQLVTTSLKALSNLLLRKEKLIRSEDAEGPPEVEQSILIKILSGQPTLLKNIVRRLCTVFGRSRASDAFLAIIFVMIFRSAPKMFLLEEHELDLLLNAFFRNSASTLKEEEPSGKKRKDDKKEEEKPRTRRRGRLAARLSEMKTGVDSLAMLNKTLKDADVVEEMFEGFKNETTAASHLLGMAISLILGVQECTRPWMRENRRIDKVVAVLYSCEKVMMAKKDAKKDERQEICLEQREGSAPWIVLGASFRILEFAVLDSVCQMRLADESRVGKIVVDVIKGMGTIKEGPFESEWMLCAALRLCINLCHGCSEASKHFVQKNGQKAVLDCIAKECCTAGLLEQDSNNEHVVHCEESFDVRVLCLALLASVVNQEPNVCCEFSTLCAEGIDSKGQGAIYMVLEILKKAECEAKEIAEEKGSDEEEKIGRHGRAMREQEVLAERQSQIVMERKITVGYVCLLIGALVKNNEKNRDMVKKLLPSNNLIGVAAVLTEFLEFHHEVGIISGSMDRMYASIIKSLVEPISNGEQILEDGENKQGSDKCVEEEIMIEEEKNGNEENRDTR